MKICQFMKLCITKCNSATKALKGPKIHSILRQSEFFSEKSESSGQMSFDDESRKTKSSDDFELTSDLLGTRANLNVLQKQKFRL